MMTVLVLTVSSACAISCFAGNSVSLSLSQNVTSSSSVIIYMLLVSVLVQCMPPWSSIHTIAWILIIVAWMMLYEDNSWDRSNACTQYGGTHCGNL